MVLISASFMLSGCASWKQKVAAFEQQTIRKSAARECTKAGWPLESPRHEECIRNTIPLLIERDRQQQAQADENLGTLLVLGASAYAAQAQGRANATAAPTGEPSARADSAQTPRASGMTYFLEAQWYENGNHFCRYGNGTVLNVGARVCPLSIQG